VDYAFVLRTLSEFLAGLRAPFAVVGGWAMNSYGRGRATFDLDLVVPREVQDQLIERLESMGYETLHCSATQPPSPGFELGSSGPRLPAR
jgi:hypothetical protein